MEKWVLTKMWGLPHGRGWAEESRDLIDAITTLENEQNMIESEEMEKAKKKSNVENIDTKDMRKG